jgi:uncharacterized protein (DUF697 family)
MTPRANTTVRVTEVGAAVVAAILSPIPLADEVVLAPVLLALAAFIGHDQGLAIRALPWRVLAKTAACGLAARAALNLAVAHLPGVSALANAVSAAALTRVYADWADRACSDPEDARVPTYKDLARAIRGRVGATL